jgi:hypothetical protein
VRDPTGDEADGYGAIVVAVLALVSVALNPNMSFGDLDVLMGKWRVRAYDISLQPYYPLYRDLLWVVRIPMQLVRI